MPRHDGARRHSAEHKRDAEGLGDAEHLPRERDAEHDAGHGIEETDDADGLGGKATESGEPRHVGDGRADHRDIGEAQEGRRRHRGRRALDHDRDRKEHERSGEAE